MADVLEKMAGRLSFLQRENAEKDRRLAWLENELTKLSSLVNSLSAGAAADGVGPDELDDSGKEDNENGGKNGRGGKIRPVACFSHPGGSKKFAKMDHEHEGVHSFTMLSTHYEDVKLEVGTCLKFVAIPPADGNVDGCGGGAQIQLDPGAGTNRIAAACTCDSFPVICEIKFDDCGFWRSPIVTKNVLRPSVNPSVPTAETACCADIPFVASIDSFDNDPSVCAGGAIGWRLNFTRKTLKIPQITLNPGVATPGSPGTPIDVVTGITLTSNSCTPCGQELTLIKQTITVPPVVPPPAGCTGGLSVGVSVLCDVTCAVGSATLTKTFKTMTFSNGCLTAVSSCA